MKQSYSVKNVDSVELEGYLNQLPDGAHVIAVMPGSGLKCTVVSRYGAIAEKVIASKPAQLDEGKILNKPTKGRNKKGRK